MKTIFTKGILLFFLVSFWSCKKDVEIPENSVSQPSTITGLRRVQLLDNLQFGKTAIKGIVTSDVASGNIDNTTLIVQEEGKEVAIVLQVNGNTDQYLLGSEVEINLEGAKIALANGELTVSDLTTSNVKLTGNNKVIAPKITNLPTIILNAQYWGPILLKLEKIDISGGDEGKLKGELTLNDGVGTVLSTVLSSSNFSDNIAPESVEVYTGILRVKGDIIYINPRNLEDIQVGLKEILEDFEDASSTNYDVKTLNFRTGSWTIDGGIVASTSSDLKNGKQSIRLQGTIGNNNRKGILSMEFDVKGVKRLKVSHGIYPAGAEKANVNPTTFDVEVSKDGGLTYTLLRQVTVDITSGELKKDNVEVNAGFSETVRFRIVNSSAPFTNNSRPRISLDDILFEF